jgi:hypothetical protein
MKPEADRDNGIETPANAGNAVLGILNDLQLRLQRIEVALAASSGDVESARKREIERRRGYTTREMARMLRCSSDSIRTMIRSGKLGAINLRQTKTGKPRFIVMPEHLAAFVEANKVYVAPKTERRRRRPKDTLNYFPATWEEYDYQVDTHPNSAQWIGRPDGRTWGPRGPVRTECGSLGDTRADDRVARATRRGRAQFCPETWEEYDAILHRHPGLTIFVLRPDGKKDGPRGPVLADANK